MTTNPSNPVSTRPVPSRLLPADEYSDNPLNPRWLQRIAHRHILEMGQELSQTEAAVKELDRSISNATTPEEKARLEKEQNDLVLADREKFEMYHFLKANYRNNYDVEAVPVEGGKEGQFEFVPRNRHRQASKVVTFFITGTLLVAPIPTLVFMDNLILKLGVTAIFLFLYSLFATQWMGVSAREHCAVVAPYIVTLAVLVLTDWSRARAIEGW